MRNRSKLLTERARLLRNHETTGEALLWEELRAGKLGVRVRRQAPLLGRFIADFVAPSAINAGYRVLRFNDALVRERLSEAVALIRVAIAQ